MDEETFLAAIWAMPNDQRTRLVYADWLDENGQPEKAEFLRLQNELAAALDRLQRIRLGLNTDWVATATVRRDLVIHAMSEDSRRALMKGIRSWTGLSFEGTVQALANLPARVLLDQPLERAEYIREDWSRFAVVTIELPVG